MGALFGRGGGDQVAVATLFALPMQIHLRLERASGWHLRD
jgi:hypothetical protein